VRALQRGTKRARVGADARIARCVGETGDPARPATLDTPQLFKRGNLETNTFPDMRKYHFLIALLVLALDRLTKWTIAHRLSLHDGVQVIPGFFRIIHAENPGAAFGIFADSPSQWKVALLILFSVIALVIISALLWKSSHTLTTTGVGLALILGGAVGNLWDRLVSGHVVDFLLFYIGRYQWPAFNVADSAIVVGAGLLVFEILFTKSPSKRLA
jgi:signal peptidase II